MSLVRDSVNFLARISNIVFGLLYIEIFEKKRNASKQIRLLLICLTFISFFINTFVIDKIFARSIVLFYGFRKGKLYRVLVRKSMDKKDNVHYKAYYVDEVLQRNVKELSLEHKYMFEAGFEDQTEDMLLFTVEKPTKGYSSE